MVKGLLEPFKTLMKLLCGNNLYSKDEPIPPNYMCGAILFRPCIGVSKGGLDMRCLLVFALVHFVLETPLFCSLRVLYIR